MFVTHTNFFPFSYYVADLILYSIYLSLVLSKGCIFSHHRNFDKSRMIKCKSACLTSTYYWYFYVTTPINTLWSILSGIYIANTPITTLIRLQWNECYPFWEESSFVKNICLKTCLGTRCSPYWIFSTCWWFKFV